MTMTQNLPKPTDEQVVLDFIKFNPKTKAKDLKDFLMTNGYGHIAVLQILDKMTRSNQLSREFNTKTFQTEYSINPYFGQTKVATTQRVVKTQQRTSPVLEAIKAVLASTNKPMHKVELREALDAQHSMAVDMPKMNACITQLLKSNVIENAGSFQINPAHRPYAVYTLVKAVVAPVSTPIEVLVVPTPLPKIVPTVTATDVNTALEDMAYSIMKERGCAPEEAIGRAKIRMAL